MANLLVSFTLDFFALLFFSQESHHGFIEIIFSGFMLCEWVCASASSVKGDFCHTQISFDKRVNINCNYHNQF